MAKVIMIPRSELRAGALLCLHVAGARLTESTALIEAGFLSQAAIVFSFGVEEFGKAILLRSAYDAGGDPAAVAEFRDHEAKLSEAAKVIRPRHLHLTIGGFDPDGFDPRGFDTGRRADFHARLDGLYVDWSDGWRYGVDVDAGVLQESIDGVRSAVEAASARWSAA